MNSKDHRYMLRNNRYYMMLYNLNSICVECPYYDTLTFKDYTKYCTKCTKKKPYYKQENKDND